MRLTRTRELLLLPLFRRGRLKSDDRAGIAYFGTSSDERRIEIAESGSNTNRSSSRVPKLTDRRMSCSFSLSLSRSPSFLMDRRFRAKPIAS